MKKTRKSIISNQSDRPIIVKGKSVPPYGTAHGISPAMLNQLRITYPSVNIIVIDGPNKPVKRGPVDTSLLPPPVVEGTIEKEKEIVSDMRKFYITGRFKGMTHIDVAGVVMGIGDRVVKEVEDCTHVLAGDNPAKSILEYVEENDIPMLSLEDIN